MQGAKTRERQKVTHLSGERAVVAPLPWFGNGHVDGAHKIIVLLHILIHHTHLHLQGI